ncbi:unnamed protein product [Adineta ricciae]|uniref:F-box domain-containing protein n=1 Tax=Adineta ricciae TaxID=249248 RepID=A0A815SR94_ADIRI|nr:unnamed protein product [Adineta ricciae]
MSQVIVEKKKAVNHIENLANETFYEIFNYLDSCHVHQAFFYLNARFRNLLIDSKFFLNIQLLIESYLTIDDQYEQYILSNRHRILSFSFDYDFYDQQFIRLSPHIDSTCVHLESINVRNIPILQLRVLLSQLKSLPRLFSFQIYFHTVDNYLVDVYQSVFKLRFLKYLKIVVSQYRKENFLLPMATAEQYTSIEFFSFCHRLSLEELINLLSYTPRLTHLHCSFIERIGYINPKEIVMNMNHLVYFNLRIDDIPSDACRTFLAKLPSQLKALTIKIVNDNKSYLDAYAWEQLIRENMPNLQKFTCHWTEFLSSTFQITDCHRTISNYLSPFWINKQWHFRITISCDEVAYSIRHNENEWYDFQEHAPYDGNLTSYYSYPGVNVTLWDIDSLDDTSYFIRLNHLFRLTDVTRLVVPSFSCPTKEFVTILRLLPNVTMLCLTLSSSSSEFLQAEDDMDRLQRCLKTSSITHVTVTNLYSENDVNFIVDLFPQMKSLVAITIPNDRLVSMTEWTLKRIKCNQMIEPMSVCIVIEKGTDDQIAKLHEMIDKEKLLSNYTIDRRSNKFYMKFN